MNKRLVVIISILAALVVVSVLKDFVVKVVVEKGVEVVTGLKLSVRSFNVGIFRTAVSIRSLKLFNPKSFKDRIMIDMPLVYVSYDLPAIIGGKIHLRKAVLDLKEFVVVKNEKGELNLNSLNVVKQQKDAKKPAQAAGKAPQIQIDDLRLKIGKAVYKDYSKGGAPSIKEFNVNIDERYTNITNPYAVVSLIVVKALSNTTIGSLANFDVGDLKGSISGTLSSAQKVAAQAAGAAQETAKKAAAETQKAVSKTAEDAVKKAADSVQDVFKSPFGGGN